MFHIIKGNSLIKAVIFDMDGVIIESEGVVQENERSIFHQLGITVTPEEHAGFTGMAGNRMWEILKEKHRFKESVAEPILMQRRLFYREFDAPDTRLVLVEGVRELIQSLHSLSYRLAVASSSSSAYVRMIIYRYGLQPLFEVFCGGDIVLQSKPAPDLFLYAAEQLGVPPAECLVIEDSRNGVLAAKAAGMQVIGYNNPQGGKQDLSKADVIISSYAEFPYNFLSNTP
jgi:HAD superfamily hydrolase (TIGR01509 family)